MDYRLERDILNDISQGQNNKAFQELISYLNTQEKRIDELTQRIETLEKNNFNDRLSKHINLDQDQ